MQEDDPDLDTNLAQRREFDSQNYSISLSYPLYRRQNTEAFEQSKLQSTLGEAQSWGKINRDANKSVAYVEASIGLSLMVGYILQSEVWKGRKRLKYTWKDDMLTKVAKVPLGL